MFVGLIYNSITLVHIGDWGERRGEAPPQSGNRFRLRLRCERAELRARKEGRAWPNADDSAERQYRFRMRPDAPGCVRMRPDASGCVGILNSSKFRRILAQYEENLATFVKNWPKKSSLKKIESRERCPFSLNLFSNRS